MTSIPPSDIDPVAEQYEKSAVAMASRGLASLKQDWERRSDGYFVAVQQLTDDLTARGYRVAGLVEWCKKWLIANNALDPDGAAACVAPDVRWDDPMLFGEQVRGHDQFRVYLNLFWDAINDLQLYPVDPPMIYVGVDQLLLCQPWHAIGTWTAPLPTWPVRSGGPTLAPTGRTIDFEGIDRYTFPVNSDGEIDWRIAHGRTVYCVANALHQVGLFPRPGSPAMAPARAGLRLAAFVLRHLPSRR